MCRVKVKKKQWGEVREASIDETFARWTKLIQELGKLKQEGSRKVKWLLAFPKFLLWSLWLERNEGIFNNLKPSLERVLARAKKLTCESISILNFKEERARSKEEKKSL
eukprot:Gb_38927 [translate_table: standard]